MSPPEVLAACECGKPGCTRKNNTAFRVGMLITQACRTAQVVVDKKSKESKLIRSSDVQIARPRGVRGKDTSLRMPDEQIAIPVSVEQLEVRIAERRERDRKAYRALAALPPFELAHPASV